MGWSSWGSGRKKVEAVSLVWVPEASRSGPSPSSGPSSSSLQIPFSKSECWSFTAGRFLCTWASRGSKRKGAMIVQREDFARAVRFWLPSAGVRRLWNTCRNSATYCEWTQSLFHLSHRTFQVLGSVTLWIFLFLLTNQFLSTLGLQRSKLQLLERVSSESVTSILHKLMEQRMERHCRGEYECSFLVNFQEVSQGTRTTRPRGQTRTKVSFWPRDSFYWRTSLVYIFTPCCHKQTEISPKVRIIVLIPDPK